VPNKYILVIGAYMLSSITSEICLAKQSLSIKCCQLGAIGPLLFSGIGRNYFPRSAIDITEYIIVYCISGHVVV
jgi:hypothetical protein